MPSPKLTGMFVASSSKKVGETRRCPRASCAADASWIKVGSEKAVPTNDSPNGTSVEVVERSKSESSRCE